MSAGSTMLIAGAGMTRFEKSRSSLRELAGAAARDALADAGVVVKNQHNGGLNPRAQYGGELTVAEVLASRTVVEPLTLLMCSPISDGAAAVVLISEAAARRAGVKGPRIRASVVRSGNVHDRSDPLTGSPALQGPPDRRHRHRPDLRVDLAAAWRGRPPSGRGRANRPHPERRRLVRG